MNDPYLSVVIPTYNEEKNIKRGVLDQVYRYLKLQDYTWEVVVADDGSSDKTVELAEGFAKRHKGFRVLREPHRGKGGVVIAGSLSAKGEIVLFTDADQSTPIDQLSKVLDKFGEGYDIVIGSRSGRKGAPLYRKVMAFGFVVFRMLVLRLPYKDTQAGFKAIKSVVAREIFRRMENLLKREGVKGSSLSAGFDVEILYLARKLGYRVASVDIKWDYHEGTSKNPIKESWIGFKGVIAVRLKSLFNYYKLR